ncbi:ParB/RepB/Spo0J family partition protein [Caballeronia sp. LZ035]|uniref:ParB/RepB/Spo0J family partition protein n=1 Tax=Caballeronia sp. LZ035 TaxID=3038568 RepID=UPI0028573294|nr:ParB/RepB/Spo0J family partition protein [Caballeronia sp. LZ035]MDR5763023.1 ParB/RepB/Spo0J family partition protein [Caballeronia sp. LZ035]
MASWMKEQAARAKNIQVTAEDKEKALDVQPVPARTAPGQLMQLQATAERQRKEIANLKMQLDKGARAKRPISKLHEVPGRRRKLTVEQYAELKANLAQHPLVHPVILEAREDGEWNINAGNNRVAIYRDLGIDEIDSIVSEMDPGQAERLAFFSNLFAPSLSDYEKYWHFQRLQEAANALTQQELATAVGLSESHVSKIFAFDGLPADAKAALEERPERLGADAAAQLSRAHSEGRTSEVVKAVERLVKEERYTQKEAVSSVQAKLARTPPLAETLIVKQGKKNYCEITTRGGVIGVRLKVEAERANEWAKEIQALIESKLK